MNILEALELAYDNSDPTEGAFVVTITISREQYDEGRAVLAAARWATALPDPNAAQKVIRTVLETSV